MTAHACETWKAPGAESVGPYSAPPPVVVKVAKPVEAALQLIGAMVLFLGDAPARHKPAPTEVG
jgi:hypothetical protein